MRPVVLRGATASDADAVARVFLAARAEMDYLPALHTVDETRAWIAQVVLTECAVTLAVDDDAVLGFSAVSGAELEHLYVHPVAHARGIGTQLLQHAMAASAGELWLYTFQRNAGARRLYERHGFAATEFTDGSRNEEHEPDIRYR